MYVCTVYCVHVNDDLSDSHIFSHIHNITIYWLDRKIKDERKKYLADCDANAHGLNEKNEFFFNIYPNISHTIFLNLFITHAMGGKNITVMYSNEKYLVNFLKQTVRFPRPRL